MGDTKFQVLLYYKYISIDDPEKIKSVQKDICERINLKGRIIIATEGINGTLEGTIENTQKYIEFMQSTQLFGDIHFKKSVGTGEAFPKLTVKVRPEIVSGKMPNLDPNKVSGKYITAEQLHEWFEAKKEFYIVDMRNDYEYISGYFENSIFSEIHNFYDLPQVLPKINHLKNKTIVTVCTGGVRCEKASGFLVTNGFADVYQLHDGIQTYMEKYPNQHFKGKLYVFDKRLTLGFNTDDPKHNIVGKCMHCSTPCDSYVNCMYDICHFHYISCTNCLDKNTGLSFCKEKCKQNYLLTQ